MARSHLPNCGDVAHQLAEAEPNLSHPATPQKQHDDDDDQDQDDGSDSYVHESSIA